MDTRPICEEIAHRLGRVESVLDVGCGDGALVRCLAERVAREAIGVDIAGSTFSEKWIAEDGSSHLAKCTQDDAHAMKSLADSHFDAVVTVHTLHHLADPVAALCEANRVLKPGGAILIADFAKGHGGERIWRETFYAPEQVDTMLKKCSFQWVEVQQVPGEHFLFALGKKMKGPLRSKTTMNEEAIIQAIQRVQHPQINCSLVDLGMVQDILVSEDGVSLKLVLPFLGIPTVIREYMANNLQQAVAGSDAELEIQVAEMTPAQRQRFLTLEQQNWKA